MIAWDRVNEQAFSLAFPLPSQTSKGAHLVGQSGRLESDAGHLGHSQQVGSELTGPVRNVTEACHCPPQSRRSHPNRDASLPGNPSAVTSLPNIYRDSVTHPLKRRCVTAGRKVLKSGLWAIICPSSLATQPGNYNICLCYDLVSAATVH